MIDTNVISEARKRDADRGVHSWFEGVDAAQLYLSVLVVGEVRQGIERLRRRDPAQAAVLERWLGMLRRDYARRILPITVEVAEEWGRLGAIAPWPAVDGLLAATAKVAGLTLVTRNIADVERTGVPVLNPFAAP